MPHRMLLTLLLRDFRPLLRQSFDIWNMHCVPINSHYERVNFLRPPSCLNPIGFWESLELAEVERPDVAVFMGVFDSGTV